jgi:anti-sigma factor RsiW
VTCADIAERLPAYLDGELDLVHTLAVEEHLQQCPACAAALKDQQALREALADPALYHRAPAVLRERVRASLRPVGKPVAAARPFPWRAVAVAASLAFVAALVWGVLRGLSLPSEEDQLAQQVVASHVRSLMVPGREVVKVSSDRHQVKPWFNRRVTFSPPVKDLEGFELIGGRLDYLDQQKVAALVYKRRGHFINLFVWPAADRSARSPQALTRQGHPIIHWADGDLTYWAVSDLNEAELRQFVDLIRGAGDKAPR